MIKDTAYNFAGGGRMTTFYTTGQIAKQLRISVSTLKRWLNNPGLPISDRRNHTGWRLFSPGDLQMLQKHKKELKRNGKKFNTALLVPAAENSDDGSANNSER
ncbi:MAG: MerR family transcriptional regulator [Chitinivibrionales bacterium]|nr:MerR family transcriptional regulator [Chitinivibrionales bacterium]